MTFFHLLALALATGCSFAAPLTLDLGQGLAYHRAHSLPADLPGSSPTA